ncbi:hypothetical protein H6F86_03170 [Phormidium sp. FACHB-592]|uniref:Uncharacterized protein n=1 Tax=Stenomitos frigidus AS-A4 TaxID=2933935 RepID=A0ABV0KNZ3_9CYAN|nr:hypothetical protein [Phormidium sp. FACHB-592]MBD2072902.1 hypothetical protein [Phormidium sp. FACHB-592]
MQPRFHDWGRSGSVGWEQAIALQKAIIGLGESGDRPSVGSAIGCGMVKGDSVGVGETIAFEGSIGRSRSTRPVLQLIQVSLAQKRSENGKIDCCCRQRRL